MSITLRPYQQEAIDKVWEYLRSNNGNPCIVAPTAFGKSIVVAKLANDTVSIYGKNVLLLTHQKELVEQDAEKMKLLGIDCGIYSAGLKKKEVKQVTCASIQTIANHIDELPIIHLLMVDEAHLINHMNAGRYRTVINNLKVINPNMRVVGLTATPYRLGAGLLTDSYDENNPALFNNLIETASIKSLMDMGYLSKLTSKATSVNFDLTGVQRQGRGDFIESQLQQAVDQEFTNSNVMNEIVKRAHGRNHWLIFCTGVEHAIHMRDEARKHNISCEAVTGKTSKDERERLLKEFKEGKITALTNANILTTGFDAPCVDLIVMLRPTMSTSLHIQMIGRGLRISPDKKNCLVLDFAENIMRHGPITNIVPPAKRKKGNGVAPAKMCPDCMEIVHPSVMTCPQCGFEFLKHEKLWKLSTTDIMTGVDASNEIEITRWHWALGRSSKNEYFVISWFGNLSTGSIKEYFVTIGHEGWKMGNAQRLKKLLRQCGIAAECKDLNNIKSAQALIERIPKNPPEGLKIVVQKKKGAKYPQVIDHVFKESTVETSICNIN